MNNKLKIIASIIFCSCFAAGMYAHYELTHPQGNGSMRAIYATPDYDDDGVIPEPDAEEDL